MQLKKLLLTTVLVIGAGLSAGAQTNTQQASPSSLAPAAQTAPQTGTPSGTTLPASGSALPLLSVIGFGVLVGGIASALKTR